MWAQALPNCMLSIPVMQPVDAAKTALRHVPDWSGAHDNAGSVAAGLLCQLEACC